MMRALNLCICVLSCSVALAAATSSGRTLLQTPEQITALATSISSGDASSIKDSLNDPGNVGLLGTQWAKATAEAYKKANSPTIYSSMLASKLVQTYDTIGAFSTAIGLASTIGAAGDAASSSALAISSAFVSGGDSAKTMSEALALVIKDRGCPFVKPTLLQAAQYSDRLQAFSTSLRLQQSVIDCIESGAGKRLRKLLEG